VGARSARDAAELGEAEYMYRMFACADDAARAALGLSQARVGGGVVTMMANDPTGGFWNRTIGLGVTEPLTTALVDEVLDLVRGGGPLTVVQLAPDAEPAGCAELVVAAGGVASASWVKFGGPVQEPPEVTTDLRVGPLDAAEGEAFARVLCVGFGMPLDSPLPGWFAQLPSWRDAGFTTYGAWDGDDLVAVATLLTYDDVASLCGAATLPEHRGRGAQGALMAERMREAARRGCSWVVTETGAETADSPNPSLHNMRRMRLPELYERRNIVWRP
jgi:GNAT superfamily N-acetyltransferase